MKLQNRISISLPAAVFSLLLAANVSFSQIRPDIQDILAEFGSNAQAYFLSANRPSYGVNAYTVPKHKFELDFSVSANNKVFDLPMSLSYGIAKNTELFTGISLYTKSYDFSGRNINGVGDANIGLKYKFQESDYFSHAVQMLVKIPTANSKTQLGTGFADFHFGVAEGFYDDLWGYDLSIELNFLKRRNFPASSKDLPIELQQSLDSLRSTYNYKYEPEFVISLGPTLDISDRVSTYAGFSFSRNLKLDYNTSEVYTGFGYELNEKTGIGLGASFAVKNTFSWLISAGINLSF